MRRIFQFMKSLIERGKMTAFAVYAQGGRTALRKKGARIPLISSADSSPMLCIQSGYFIAPLRGAMFEYVSYFCGCNQFQLTS